VPEDLNKPRINIIQLGSAARQKIETNPAPPDLPLIGPERQSSLALRRAHCRTLLFGRHRSKIARFAADRPPDNRRKLASVQNPCCNIAHNRIQAVRLCVTRSG
jgi:hypothetical protein